MATSGPAPTGAAPGGQAPKRTKWYQRWWLWVIVVAVIAALVWGVPYVYANVLPDGPAPLYTSPATSESTSQPASGEDASETAESTTGSTDEASGPAEGATSSAAQGDPNGRWTAGAGSLAGYRVDEVLNGQDKTVVGRTEGVTGTVTIEGGQLTAAHVEVDMATVTTDSAQRDGQFTQIVKASEFPVATFDATGPVTLDVASGAADVPGVLTVAGASADVTASTQFRGSSDGSAIVTGAIPITFSDFDIEAPSLGFVQVEKSGQVEFELHLTRE